LGTVVKEEFLRVLRCSAANSANLR